jgi:anti-sigma regulatory factor (Ser/Thr protein kinase)
MSGAVPRMTDDSPLRDRQPMASAAVFLAFEPSSAFVQRVIRWLTDFCQLTLADLELVARLRLAVSELVENVVKYGMQPNVRVEVELVEREGAAILRLGTHNRSSPEYLARAVELLSELKDAPDPLAYYDRLVRESAPKLGVSGLGLARIRAEGELELDFKVVGDELSIWVEAPVDAAIGAQRPNGRLPTDPLR